MSCVQQLLELRTADMLVSHKISESCYNNSILLISHFPDSCLATLLIQDSGMRFYILAKYLKSNVSHLLLQVGVDLIHDP